MSTRGGLVTEQKIDGGSEVVTEGLAWDCFSCDGYVAMKSEI